MLSNIYLNWFSDICIKWEKLAKETYKLDNAECIDVFTDFCCEKVQELPRDLQLDLAQLATNRFVEFDKITPEAASLQLLITRALPFEKSFIEFECIELCAWDVLDKNIEELANDIAQNFLPFDDKCTSFYVVRLNDITNLVQISAPFTVSEDCIKRFLISKFKSNVLDIQKETISNINLLLKYSLISTDLIKVD